MPTQDLLELAAESFRLGLIGIDEYCERRDVALWLAEEPATGSGDPREDMDAEKPPDTEVPRLHEPPVERAFSGVITETWAGAPDEPSIVHFVFKPWIFTIGDPDDYPSVPHGHLESALRRWPKLNPYTGRVFAGKHLEDKRLRLSKADMRSLWRDSAFRDFCRDHISWYGQAHGWHRLKFQPLRLPRW